MMAGAAMKAISAYCLAGILLMMAGPLQADPPPADSLPAAPMAERMPITDARELHAIYADSTMSGHYVYDGVISEVWNEYHCASGRTIYQHGSSLLDGRWWIAESRVCFGYNIGGRKVFEHDQYCFDISRDAEGHYYSRNVAEPGIDTWSIIHGYQRGDPLRLQQQSGMACEDLSS